MKFEWVVEILARARAESADVLAYLKGDRVANVEERAVCSNSDTLGSD